MGCCGLPEDEPCPLGFGGNHMWCEPRREALPDGIPTLQLERLPPQKETDFKGLSLSLANAGAAPSDVVPTVASVMEACEIELAHEEAAAHDDDRTWDIHCIQHPTKGKAGGLTWLVHYKNCLPCDAWPQAQSFLRDQMTSESWSELVEEHASATFAACGRDMRPASGPLQGRAPAHDHAPDLLSALAVGYVRDARARCTQLYLKLLGEVLRGVANGQNGLAFNLTAATDHGIKRATCQAATRKDFEGIMGELLTDPCLAVCERKMLRNTSHKSPSGELLAEAVDRHTVTVTALSVRAWAKLWGGSDAVSADVAGTGGEIRSLVAPWFRPKAEFSPRTHPAQWKAIEDSGEVPTAVVPPTTTYPSACFRETAADSWFKAQRFMVLDYTKIDCEEGGGEKVRLSLAKVLWVDPPVSGSDVSGSDGQAGQCGMVHVFGTKVRGLVCVLPVLGVMAFTRAPSLAFTAGRSSLLSCEVHGPISCGFCPGEVTRAGYFR